MMLLTTITVRPPLHAKLFDLPSLVYQVIHRDMKNVPIFVVKCDAPSQCRDRQGGWLCYLCTFCNFFSQELRHPAISATGSESIRLEPIVSRNAKVMKVDIGSQIEKFNMG